MKLRVVDLFKALVIKFFSSIKRFPITLFIVLVTAALLIYQNHNYDFVTNQTKDLIKRLTMI